MGGMPFGEGPGGKGGKGGIPRPPGMGPGAGGRKRVLAIGVGGQIYSFLVSEGREVRRWRGDIRGNPPGGPPGIPNGGGIPPVERKRENTSQRFCSSVDIDVILWVVVQEGMNYTRKSKRRRWETPLSWTGLLAQHWVRARLAFCCVGRCDGVDDGLRLFVTDLYRR